MGKQFGAVKIKVSLKEKRRRVAHYLENSRPSDCYTLNVDKYLAIDIYDEYVVMHCPSCQHEEHFDLQFVDSLFSLYGNCCIECPKCHRDKLVPADLHETDNDIDNDLPF